LQISNISWPIYQQKEIMQENQQRAAMCIPEIFTVARYNEITLASRQDK
jgi:hypothetical protein